MKQKVANIVFNSFTNDSRVVKESISLSHNGYTVEVIAHGDKNLDNHEQKENFSIKRFSYLDRKITTGKFEKLKIYFDWVKKVVYYTKDFDIIHCNDLNTLPVAFIIKKFYNKNIKIVYDAHEYETEVIGLSKTQKIITKQIEKFLIKYADAVICVSDAIANEYAKLYNIKKPSLVLNTPKFKNTIKKDLFREIFDIEKEQTIFLYQGNFGKGRGIEVLLDIFIEQFTKNQKIKTKNYPVIVFMGYGELEPLLKKVSKKYENIYYHDAVTPEILLDYTGSADFGISTIENSCLSYYYCLPNKLFEYIMAEVPVIVSNLPEMKKIVNDNNIGVVAEDGSTDKLKQAIEEAIKLDREIMRINLQKLKKVYNWEQQEKVLIKTYKEIINYG